MPNSLIAFVLTCVLALSMPLFAATPALGPVILIAFENHSYSAVMGSTGASAMPYLHALIGDYALANNFTAEEPGSVADYFDVTTGNHVSTSTGYKGPYTGNNLARVLIAKNKSWKVYAQGLPSVGYVGTCCYPYVKYHNPFAYFSDVLSGTERNNIVPLTEWQADIGAPPSFSLIIPDNRHNAHDCPNGGSSCTDSDKLHAADLFLQDAHGADIPALLATPAFQPGGNGLLVIWWDEGSGGSEHVAITLGGPPVKKGYRSPVSYRDPNLLRTIIEGLGLSSFPGTSSSASDMSDIF